MAFPPIDEIAHQVRSGQRSARSFAQESLELIASKNPQVNAFVALDPERSLAQASAVDELVAEGVDPGPLAGVPLGVKDLEDAVGFVTTEGSPLNEHAAAALHDSLLVARLRRAGCVVIGKTNTPPYGWTARTDNALFGLTRNPWNLDHHAGGSSGGSAAAVSSGMLPLATASDGGGSIRIPASICGLPGFKASFGRVPNGGAEAPGWLALSSKGILARSVRETALATEIIVGPDPSDLGSLPRPEASWLSAIEDPHTPAKVAWSPSLGYAEADREVLDACLRALDLLEASGVEVVEIKGPFDHDPVMEWLTIVNTCLARSTLDLREHPRYTELDQGLRNFIAMGDEVSGTQLVEALDASHHANLQLVELFSEFRLLISPTLASLPPAVADGSEGMVNGQRSASWVGFTYPFNLTKSPAMSIPVGLSSSGLPIGMQLIGPQHGDLVVLRAAAALEAMLQFKLTPEAR